MNNSLLDTLPARQLNAVIAACELVQLPFGRLLSERQQNPVLICFPLTAILAVVSSVSGHPPLGVVMTGNEGMAGATFVLGLESAPLRVIVQGAGSAYLISQPVFRDLLRTNPALKPVISRYLYSQYEQFAQAAGCARFHEVEARLARWLLLTHDRSADDSFRLTHQFLADMLGVQRSAVTIAAGLLQRQGLISYSWGEITITDRKGLEALCCECYVMQVAGGLQLPGTGRHLHHAG